MSTLSPGCPCTSRSPSGLPLLALAHLPILSLGSLLHSHCTPTICHSATRGSVSRAHPTSPPSCLMPESPWGPSQPRSLAATALSLRAELLVAARPLLPLPSSSPSFPPSPRSAVALRPPSCAVSGKPSPARRAAPSAGAHKGCGLSQCAASPASGRPSSGGLCLPRVPRACLWESPQGDRTHCLPQLSGRDRVLGHPLPQHALGRGLGKP